MGEEKKGPNLVVNPKEFQNLLPQVQDWRLKKDEMYQELFSFFASAVCDYWTSFKTIVWWGISRVLSSVREITIR